MWFHYRVYLDLTYYSCTVHYCTTYEYIRTSDVFVYTCLFPTAAAAVCCYTAVAEAAVLLLAADVRHRVLDGKVCCCGLLHLILVFVSVHSNTLYFKCTPWQYSRFYILQPPFTFNTYLVPIIHPRHLRACAEPRRASLPAATKPPL